MYDAKSAKLQETVTKLSRLRVIKESEEREMEALEARLFRLQNIDEIQDVDLYLAKRAPLIALADEIEVSRYVDYS